VLNVLTDFNHEVKVLYLRVIREGAMSNVLTRRDYITDNLETDLEESIHKYVQLLKDLEDYPEW
jgi:hypothetical protein